MHDVNDHPVVGLWIAEAKLDNIKTIIIDARYTAKKERIANGKAKNELNALEAKLEKNANINQIAFFQGGE
ncbi:MAG: hypothetical protein VX987_03920 [Pseudomonadota bacterium]|nr:hypothetical protein [Pseudomonadota bacterium]